MLHWTSAAQCWGCCFIRRFPLTLDLRHLNGQRLLFGMCESAGVVWRVSPDNDLFKGCVCMFVYVLSGVRFFAAPQTVAHHAPMSMGFFQARILEWVAISSSRGSSWSRDGAHISSVSCIARQTLYHCATWES